MARLNTRTHCFSTPSKKVKVRHEGPQKKTKVSKERYKNLKQYHPELGTTPGNGDFGWMRMTEEDFNALGDQAQRRIWSVSQMVFENEAVLAKVPCTRCEEEGWECWVQSAETRERLRNLGTTKTCARCYWRGGKIATQCKPELGEGEEVGDEDDEVDGEERVGTAIAMPEMAQALQEVSSEDQKSLTKRIETLKREMEEGFAWRDERIAALEKKLAEKNT